MQSSEAIFNLYPNDNSSFRHNSPLIMQWLLLYCHPNVCKGYTVVRKFKGLCFLMEHAVAPLVEALRTIRKVAGSIIDGVRPQYGTGFDSASNRNE